MSNKDSAAGGALVESDGTVLALFVDAPPDPHAELRRRVEEKRAANRRRAEGAQAEAEPARLLDQEAFEDALETAYSKYGPGQVISGEITGSGWVILRWPNDIEYKVFADRGILKQDGLTLGLCDQICAQCLVYPDAEKFKGDRKRKPHASIKLANRLVEAMSPKAEAEGKE